MTEAERKVKAKYPDAHCSGPMLNGRSDPKGGYSIVLHLTASALFADGKTPELAWEDAARRLEARTP